MSLLEAKNIKKVYKTRFGGASVEALKNVSFTVEKGEYVAIMGESGSGKTTLLNIIAALDRATEGTVILDGMDLSKVKDKDVAKFRRDNLGYVFQEFNLLDTFSLEDNIYLPLVLAGKKHAEMKQRLDGIAGTLGISDLLKKYPYEVQELLSQTRGSSSQTSLPELWIPSHLTNFLHSLRRSTRWDRRSSWLLTPQRLHPMHHASSS